MIKGLKFFQATGPISSRACQLNHPSIFPRLTYFPAPASALSIPLSRCCQTHDHCYSEAKKLDSCKFLLDNPYTKVYSYSCSGSEITCSGR